MPSGSVADGVLVVDKPAGWTSHDVVARVRRLVGTRRVGHAGTLDPMATGVLVVGVGRATRLLGYLSGHEKEYQATLRLGVATTSDDADGEVVAATDAAVASAVGDDVLAEAITSLTGEVAQVPPVVSAIKVEGRRAYARARAGEAVELAPRLITVRDFRVTARRGDEVDVHVECSAGTYVRALARDVGAALGVGAHLTALRRLRSGPFVVAGARTLHELAELAELTGEFGVTPMADVARLAFPVWTATGGEAVDLSHGRRVPAPNADGGAGSSSVVAVIGPDGELVALVDVNAAIARPLAVFTPAQPPPVRPGG